MLSAESSAEPGRWNTSKAEFQRGIHDAVSDPLITEISVVASSQVGKTEFELNVIGYHVDQDPCSILMIEPTLELSQSFSKDRLDPMIRDTPCLRGKIIDVRQKDKSNTILHKKFPGGLLVMAGANSPASLASRPIRKVLFDEVDRYEASIGGKGNSEGDPISIGKKRAITYRHRRQYIYVSTPTIDGVSRIMFSFAQSDQRHYMVPCPKCGHFQKLIFSKGSQYSGMSAGRVVFDEANLSWVYYECEECKAQLGEADKYKMVRAGRWEVTRPEIVGHAGFHISELYSPWSSWKFMAEEFLKAKKRREALQVWVNTSLGETWREDDALTVTGETLLSRREEYAKIPAGALLLTAGVDTQDDRLEYAVKGWNGRESWLIAYRVIYGNPSDLTVWQALDDVLGGSLECEDGVRLRIDCAFIDSAGHYTQEVYKYVRAKAPARVFAVVGRGGAGRPLIGKLTRNNRERARLIPIGVDDAKTTIMRNLALDKPTQPEHPYPQGYMHFPMWTDEAYFNMLTAERQVLRKSGGAYHRVWEKKSASARNEALDCEVYAMAAMAFLNPNFEALAKRREVQLAALENAPPERMKQEAPRPRGGIKRVGQFG